MSVIASGLSSYFNLSLLIFASIISFQFSGKISYADNFGRSSGLISFLIILSLLIYDVYYKNSILKRILDFNKKIFF